MVKIITKILVSELKTMEIVLNNYTKVLAEVKKQIALAQLNIAEAVIREKVVLYWNIGRIITDHLNEERADGNKSGYGRHLIKQLSADIGFEERTIYRVQNFYQTYSQLPAENGIDWSHYRLLATINDEDKRKCLENLTIEKNLSVKELEQEAKELKSVGEVEVQNFASPLRPSRGTLWTYKLKKLDGVAGFKKENLPILLDCGFHIFKTIEIASNSNTICHPELVSGSKFLLQEKMLKQVQHDKIICETNFFKNAEEIDEMIVEVVKNGDKYSFKKSDVKNKNTNTYKAYIERVVDGDTLRVILDLGFGLFHREILRLKGIDSPEMSTEEGQASKQGLQKILSGIEFVVVKTIKTDIYGRYVADVFLPIRRDTTCGVSTTTDEQDITGNGKYLNQLLLDTTCGVSTTMDEQDITDNGKYLNQFLLDKGLAKRLEM
jgi:endonuclease YncB( thermonuclease family)